MSGNTYNENQRYQSSVTSLRWKVSTLAAALAAGVALYNSEKISDFIPPAPPVVQVYNNNACLTYDDRIYTLKNEIAKKGDGIHTLLLRYNPHVTPRLEDAFKAANSGSKFFYGSGLYERKQYLTPAPDKENKCK